MKNKGQLIKQICKSGVLISLAIVLGVFANFHFFGGHIFLVGGIIFLFPLFLKIPFAFLSTIISVTLVDLFSNSSQYIWISIIAYGVSIVVISLFSFLKFKLFYLAGVILASLLNVGIFYLLERVAFDSALATSHLIPNLIQFAFVLGIVFVAYFPLKLLAKVV